MFEKIKNLIQARSKKNFSGFEANVVIDVTNFAAKSPEDDLGYMADAKLTLDVDGNILVTDSENRVLESCNITEAESVNDNLFNYHPDFLLCVQIMTESHAMIFTFENDEKKKAFVSALKEAYNNAISKKQ